MTNDNQTHEQAIPEALAPVELRAAIAQLALGEHLHPINRVPCANHAGRVTLGDLGGTS